MTTPERGRDGLREAIEEAVSRAVTLSHGWAGCRSEFVSAAELRRILDEHPATGHEERCGHPNHGGADHDCTPFRAEPGAGEAEGLAEALGDIRVAGARQADWWTNDEDHALLARVLRAECVPWAEGLLTSDWLAAHVAKAKAEALREAAHDAHSTFMSGKTLGAPTDDWLRDRADRIEGR